LCPIGERPARRISLEYHQNLRAADRKDRHVDTKLWRAPDS
jgi:hypothetical protein